MGTMTETQGRKGTAVRLAPAILNADYPDLFIERLAAAGSDSLLVHWEGNRHLRRTVRLIKTLGKQAGVVLDPATPSTVLEESAR
jgi:ribulose-phosphate 3-epimerase